MPRSKRDDMKREMAQCVNHQAKAVLNIANVQAEFDEWELEEGQKLEQLAVLQNTLREQILIFVQNSWGLDEQALMSFM